jgi:hypothetical protein
LTAVAASTGVEFFAGGVYEAGEVLACFYLSNVSYFEVVDLMDITINQK